jgi:D-alanine-D-alanine ligase
MTRHAVVFGGPSPEHDISILTGLMAARTLVESGTEVRALYWTKTGDWYEVPVTSEAADFLQGVPRGSDELGFVAAPGAGWVAEGRLGKPKPLGVEAVLNACHGGPGEDGALQAAFDLAGIRSSGPATWAASLAMDKLAFGAVMETAGLPTLPRRPIDQAVVPDFDGPYIAKPRFGGSSIGIEVVDDHATALALAASSPHYTAGGVLEPYLDGADDLNVSIRTWPELQISPIERPLRGGALYDYKEKYLSGGGLEGSRRELPANIAEETAERIRDLATTVARLTGTRGVARLDFLWTGEDLYVNEINNPPGSLSHYLWAEAGVTTPELVRGLLEEAERGRGPGWTAVGADGTALRDAGSIAAKLG